MSLPSCPSVLLLSLASSMMACGLHVTHHTVVFRDPAAVSVLIHPPGPGLGVLSLPTNEHGAGVSVSYTDLSDEHPSWSLRALRDDIGAISLEFRSGESLLSDIALVDSAGALYGGALMDQGVYTNGDRTVVRDADGLVWTRVGYVPTAPSKRQEREPDWQRIASHMESSGPGAISLVTALSNVASIRKRTEVPWEAPALLLTLGAVMIAASIPLFVESGADSLTAEERGLSIGVGVAAAVGGLVSVGVGTAGFLARGADETLDPETLPVQRPRSLPTGP